MQVVAVGVLLLALPQVALTAQATQQEDRLAPGPQHATNIVVGEPSPADFALTAIDGATYELGKADRPLLLLFFRGTW
jgi:hypothetical protein